MQHIGDLRKKRGLLGEAHTAPLEEASFSGPSLIDQEPDLAKESGQHVRDASGWAAGGQPPD